MAKGGQFERDICRTLSLWWTRGKDDSCLWRTSQSGGRATVRHRKGKATRGHVGDITATDEVALPLTKRITFELKRGYNRAPGPLDLLDSPKSNLHRDSFESFIAQAIRAAKVAKTPDWALIWRRDTKKSTIWISSTLDHFLRTECLCLQNVGSCILLCFGPDHAKQSVVGYDLQEWLEQVDPSDITEIPL